MAYVQGPFKTFPIGTADIPAGSAVKIASGVVVVATAATDVILGTTAVAFKGTSTAGSAGVVDVRLRTAEGTSHGVAGGTIAVNDALTSNGSGQLITTTTAGNQIVGYAVTTATVGKLVEFTPTTAKY